MKKILLLLCILIGCTLNAQEHLKFLDIPLDGTIQEFSEKLQEKGFTFNHRQEDSYYFRNSTGEKDMANVVVTCTPEDKGSLVCIAYLVSDPQLSFKLLESIYKKQQKMLDSKYGEGFYDEFIENKYDSDDMTRLLAIVKDKGHYKSTYQTKNGLVELGIIGEDYMGYVACAYTDRINGKILEKYQ